MLHLLTFILLIHNLDQNWKTHSWISESTWNFYQLQKQLQDCSNPEN